VLVGSGMAKAAAGPITDLLTRLDAALAKHHPKLQRRLNKGASAAALAKLEKVAGARLPEAFTAFLRWHDGAPSEIRLLDGMCWLDAKRCASIKAMMDSIIADGHYASWAEDEWWSTGWVPFADDESGYGNLVVDLRGSFGGTPGQVLRAAAKDGYRAILAPSFEAWLESFTQIAEKDLFECDSDDESTLRFGSAAEAVFKKRKGYPRVTEPRPVEVVFDAGPSEAPNVRARWPEDVPTSARWLTSGDKHWLIALAGKTVSTWAGASAIKLARQDSKAKNEDAASTAFDQALRKKLSAGFIFGVPSASTAKRGDLVCALDVGDGSNAEFIDVSPDGRTLALASIFRDAQGARLSLVEIETGRRRELHRFETGGRQTFVHRIAFDSAGTRLFVQLSAQLWQIAISDGATKLLADIESPRQTSELFNPHVSRFDIDAKRERMLVLDHAGIHVYELAAAGLGKRRLKIPVKRGTSEYRELALSPSGKLLAAVHRSRARIYGHDDAEHDTTNEIQIWSVDDAKLLRSLPYGNDEYIRGFGVSPDDRLLLVGDYRNVKARDIVTGERRFTREGREWAYSPDGSQLALGRRGTQIEVRSSKTGRKSWATDPTRLWATPYAEIQDIQRLGFSADGRRLFEGGGSGRVYVWAV
jgi:cell wall assembly regulator SMI1